MVRKITIKRPDAKTFRGWGFVLVAGGVLTVLALYDRGDLGLRGDADGSTGCVMVVQVASGELNLREGPTADSAAAGTLDDGTRVDATTEVVGGFRRLESGRWAAESYLAPEPGSTC